MAGSGPGRPGRHRPRAVEPLLQDEVAECGLACVVMVARAQGSDVTLPALRARHPASTAGTSLWDLRARLRELGITAHPVEFTPEALDDLPLPAIAHFGGHHFVVLADRAGAWLRVLNPASGEAFVPAAGLRDRLSGRALIIDAGEDGAIAAAGASSRPTTSPASSRLSPDLLARPHLRRLMPLALTAGLLALVVPMALSRVLDLQAPGAGGASSIAIAAVLGCVIASVLADLLLGGLQIRTGQAVETRVLPELFARLMRKWPRFFEKRDLADIYQRFSAFAPVVSGRAELTAGVRTAALSAAVCLALMVWLHPSLALLSLAAVALMGLVSAHYEPRRAALRLAAEEASAARNEFVFETIRGVAAIKSAGLEDRRAAGFAAVLRQAQTVARTIGTAQLRQEALYKLISRGESVLLLVIGLRLLERGQLSLGHLLVFTLLKDIAIGAATTLFFARMTRREQEVVEGRAGLMVDAAEEPAVDGSAPAVLSATLSLQDVHLVREDGSPLLGPLDLTLRRGEKVALVGPSGCGKSSLLRLIGGASLASAGAVRVDGRATGGPALRAVVFHQDAQGVLFQGSVLDNVAAFGAHASDEGRVKGIADRLGLGPVIDALPHGWATRISESAPLMSSGQRQRLLVARALGAPQPVVLLDEPTANLDDASAGATLDALLASDKSLLVVLHDRRQAARFDRVLVLESGRLIEFTAPGNIP